MPSGAEGPDTPDPIQPPLDNSNCSGGSIIECENQALGEVVPIAGTPFFLRYSSNRVPGALQPLTITLSGATVPRGLQHIQLDIYLAGQTIARTFPAAAQQSYVLRWDDTDVFGRLAPGPQPITVRIGYVYRAVYQPPDEQNPSFASFSDNDIDLNDARTEFTLWQEWHGELGQPDPRSIGLGGWTLSVHHIYDPVGPTLYLGDGTQRSALDVQDVSSVLTRVTGRISGYGGANNGDGGPVTQAKTGQIGSLTVGPDGSVYVGDITEHRIRRIAADGIITTVAGTGADDSSGDGVPATHADVAYPEALAVGPDGSLYIHDGSLLRRLGPDGLIHTIARVGGSAMAVGPDGTVYVGGLSWVVKVEPGGQIETVAGSGTIGESGDGGPATRARLGEVRALAVGPDGNLYILEGRPGCPASCVVRRVGVDGLIRTVVGMDIRTSRSSAIGDGGLATTARLSSPADIALGPDGSLYIADTGHQRIRRVGPDGIITTVAGGGQACCVAGSDGLPATQVAITPYHIALAPDGSLYYSNLAIWKVASSLPQLAGGGMELPSWDGSEVYLFDGGGRHLRTLDALTGALRYQFGYDAAGHLSNVTDGDGNVTTIEHDSSGNPTAIVNPDGQRTILSVDGHGYLASVTDPAGEPEQFGYTANGLLTTLTDPNGYVHRFAYDPTGLLIQDANPAGGVQALARSVQGRGRVVVRTMAQDSSTSTTTTYTVQNGAIGGQHRLVTWPDGTHSLQDTAIDGTRTLVSTDGTTTTLVQGPDPRFGMQAPVPSHVRITTPAGRVLVLAASRTIVPGTNGDPSRIAALTSTVTINANYNTRDSGYSFDRTYRSTYNAAAKTVTLTTPANRRTVRVLDAHGRVIEARVAGLTPVQLSYDARGRLAALTQGPRVTTFTYDPRGQLASVMDPLGHTEHVVYDAAGRVTTQTRADGTQIGYGYDANGNLTAIRPPGRPRHSLTYTAMNQVQSYSPPAVGGGTTPAQYTYNLAGDLAQVTRPDGSTVPIGYDPADRPSTLTLPQGAMRYAYDPTSGRLRTITTPDGETTTYGYDGSLLSDISMAGPISGTVHRTVRSDGLVSAESIDGGAPVDFHFDVDGLVRGIGSFSLNRDAQNGLLLERALGNVEDDFTYDTFGDVTAYQADTYHGPLIVDRYTRDALGRITQRTESISSSATMSGTTQTTAYTYDALGQITQVTQDGRPLEQYSYDANGNRLSATTPQGTVSGSYDEQDRLLRYGTITYGYTANGELRQATDTANGATTTYGYDALGNLTSVNLPNRRQIAYLYDGSNLRIGKRINGTLVQGFLYDGSALNPVAELDGHGNLVESFRYASNRHVPDYILKDNKVYVIITDQVGSVRLVVNEATQQVVQRMDYDAFGNVTLDTNPGFQPFGFAGGLYDSDTKLVRFGARDYEPHAGRWMTKDPIGFAGGDTNLYGYVGNDPVNVVDATGLFLPIGLLVGIGTLVGGVAAGIAGWLNCDRGWALVADIVNGMISGGANGLAAGLPFAALGTGVISGLGGALGQAAANGINSAFDTGARSQNPFWSGAASAAVGALPYGFGSLGKGWLSGSVEGAAASLSLNRSVANSIWYNGVTNFLQPWLLGGQ